MTPIGVVGGAGAFGRYHGGAQRMQRRAGGAERRAIMGLFNPLEDLAADAPVVFPGVEVGDLEAPFGVVGAVLPAQLITAFGDGADAPPLLVARLEYAV